MLTISQFKVIFNQKTILGPADRATKKILDGVGSYCRTVAKNSMIDMFVAKGNAKAIKKRERKLKKAGFDRGQDNTRVSKPGNPAFSKIGYIKQFIYFATDVAAKNVVIGPAKLTGVKSKDAVKTLEYGGVEQIFIGGPKRRISVSANYRARPTMHLAFDKTMQKKLPVLLKAGLI